jgi:hypothetical protein
MPQLGGETGTRVCSALVGYTLYFANTLELSIKNHQLIYFFKRPDESCGLVGRSVNSVTLRDPVITGPGRNRGVYYSIPLLNQKNNFPPE